MKSGILSLYRLDDLMKEPVISYRQMCKNEQVKVLERGFNYRLTEHYSVLLLSCQSSALYQNRISANGSTIVCEGHDVRKNMLQLDPKQHDQPKILKSGQLTQNGLFARAAEDYFSGTREAENVKVYEKLLLGMWRDRGFYRLTRCAYLKAGSRMVFRFYLERFAFGRSNIIPVAALSQVTAAAANQKALSFAMSASDLCRRPEERER